MSALDDLLVDHDPEPQPRREFVDVHALEYDSPDPSDVEAYYASLDAERETAAPDHDPEPQPLPAPGSFADRVTTRQVDLIQLIRDGLPERIYLPASHGMLVRGKRHHMPAPQKVGKSIATLVHIVDMVLAGAKVVIFDRENGSHLYAERLEQIIASRNLSGSDQDKLARGIAYYEFPRFRDTDQADLVALCDSADLVVFDSQRMFLTDLKLEENSTDDYAEFMAALVEPLFLADTPIATLILDNTGHADPKRGRGSSSKGDLNEINFTLETVEPFDLTKTGRVRLDIKTSRFGTSGRWELEIGGGIFGSWQNVESAGDTELSGFRPTKLMERASIFIEMCVDPPSRRTITDNIGGKAKFARIAIERLIQEGYARGAKGQGVESIKPYREATDPDSDQPAETADGDGIPW